METYFVTSNENKFREFKEILGMKLKRVNLDINELQAVEAEKVVEDKVKQAFNKIKKPVICDDTGLYFEAWNGLPGVLIKFFEKTIGYPTLCKLLKNNRKAKAKTVIGFFDGKNYMDFSGEISGTIAKKPRGENNFGWDVIFIPNGYKKKPLLKCLWEKRIKFQCGILL